jgi:hypothetical protein
MSQQAPRIDGYTVGKTYKTFTNASLCAWMMYAVVILLVAIQIVLAIQEPSRDPKLLTAVIIGAVCLAAAIGFSSLHAKSPQRKYTVLRTFSNADGTFASEVRYVDGTTKIKQLGNGDGFWKQLGGLMKATATGK